MNPTDYLPETPEEQPTRAQLQNAYEASDPPVVRWENKGDATPDAHGGLWISYDTNDVWEVVETVPAAVVFDDSDRFNFDGEGDQYVRTARVPFSDVVSESGEWTDDLAHMMDTLHRPDHTPAGAIVDGNLTGHVAHHATGPRGTCEPVGHGPDAGIVRKDTYADVLDSVGVEVEL